MVNDTPCTGVCRMKGEGNKARCIACNRTYDDLDQWMYMTSEARIERIKQLKKER